MSDFAPPSGPPPPKVPEGWKAQWNAQYNEWFYVNIYTKKSQWDKPTEPVYPPSTEGAPPGPPPGYSGGSMGSGTPSDTKQNPYETNHASTESDAELARRLQAEEDERARGASSSRNAMTDYASTAMPTNYQTNNYLLENKRRGGSCRSFWVLRLGDRRVGVMDNKVVGMVSNNILLNNNMVVINNNLNMAATHNKEDILNKDICNKVVTADNNIKINLRNHQV